MYNFWLRGNAILFHSVTVLVTLAVLSALTTVFYHPQPIVESLELSSIQKVRSRYNNYVTLNINADADLSSVFNWNVKQIFVWVQTNFQTKQGDNQIVIWDKIIRNGENAKISLNNMRLKYPISTHEVNPGLNMTLEMWWEVFPITGWLYREGQKGGSFTVPQKY